MKPLQQKQLEYINIYTQCLGFNVMFSYVWLVLSLGAENKISSRKRRHRGQQLFKELGSIIMPHTVHNMFH